MSVTSSWWACWWSMRSADAMWLRSAASTASPAPPCPAEAVPAQPTIAATGYVLWMREQVPAPWLSLPLRSHHHLLPLGPSRWACASSGCMATIGGRQWRSAWWMRPGGSISSALWSAGTAWPSRSPQQQALRSRSATALLGGCCATVDADPLRVRFIRFVVL